MTTIIRSNHLNIKAFVSLTWLFLAMAALLFIPAWTLWYGQAWIFLITYFTFASAIIFYLAQKDPTLLKRRMSGGPFAEKNQTQKIIMFVICLSFASLLILASLDHRFVWSHMSSHLTLLGDALVAFGWLIIFFVFRVNTFASSTIELASGQKVISNGPYAYVRHPLYTGALVILFGIPFALGSWWAALISMAMIYVFKWRLLDEEKFLIQSLLGYEEYQQKVRYRLLPLLW